MRNLIIFCAILACSCESAPNNAVSYNGFDLTYGANCIVGPYDDEFVGDIITGESSEPAQIILEAVHVPGVIPVRHLIKHTTYPFKNSIVHAVLYSVNSDTIYLDELTTKTYNKLFN